MRKYFIIASIAASVAISVNAKERVTLEDRLPVEGQTEFVLDVPVGQIDLETHDKPYIDVHVKVEENDASWFSSADLGDVQIEKDISGDRIALEIDLEDTKQTWRIKVPASMDLDIDLGVGEVTLSDISRSVNLDVGVGDAEIDLDSDNYSRIRLDAGVGDADLDGFRRVSEERAIVSKTVKWRGDGEYEIDGDVGVGDIHVRH